MKKLILIFILLLFVTPAQARNDSSRELTLVERLKKTLGFLPVPPPVLLPPLPVPPVLLPPLPGMSGQSPQEIVDRYYRTTEPERYQSRHYEDNDQDDNSHKKGKKKKHQPRGLKKKEARGKELPPGWRKKIARGEVLDRDLRGHCQELPRELYRELPPPPRGTRFVRLEDQIIRVVEATFEIIDVFTVGR